MLALGIEKMSELAVIECEGRIVHSEAAKLREAVTSQQDARIIVLDLSEVSGIDGTGLSTLVLLQRWEHPGQQCSKSKLHSKLDLPRARGEIWLPYCCGRLTERARIRGQVSRLGELNTIEQVVRLPAELQIHSLREI
jgi:anti-anti-sigma regulatory factor